MMNKVVRYSSVLMILAIVLAAISACAAPVAAPGGAAEPPQPARKPLLANR